MNLPRASCVYQRTVNRILRGYKEAKKPFRAEAEPMIFCVFPSPQGVQGGGVDWCQEIQIHNLMSDIQIPVRPRSVYCNNRAILTCTTIIISTKKQPSHATTNSSRFSLWCWHSAWSCKGRLGIHINNQTSSTFPDGVTCPSLLLLETTAAASSWCSYENVFFPCFFHVWEARSDSQETFDEISTSCCCADAKLF